MSIPSVKGGKRDSWRLGNPGLVALPAHPPTSGAAGALDSHRIQKLFQFTIRKCQNEPTATSNVWNKLSFQHQMILISFISSNIMASARRNKNCKDRMRQIFFCGVLNSTVVSSRLAEPYRAWHCPVVASCAWLCPAVPRSLHARKSFCNSHITSSAAWAVAWALGAPSSPREPTLDLTVTWPTWPCYKG